MSGLPAVLVAIVAIVVAACSLAVTAVGLRRKSEDDYTARLEKRLEELEAQNIQQEREIDECKRGRAEIQSQQFALLLEMHELRRKVGDT